MIYLRDGWVVEVIFWLLHQLICVWVKPITCMCYLQAAFFLEQAVGRSYNTKERCFGHLADWKHTIFSEDGLTDLMSKEFMMFHGCTICWCVSSGRLKICPQFRRTGIASKVDNVLFIFVGEFSCLPFSLPISSSTSDHEVMLIASLSKMLTRKNPSCMAGLGKLCSHKIVGSKLLNWMRDNPFVWQEMWFVLTTSSKSDIILPFLISRIMCSLSMMHFQEDDLPSYNNNSIWVSTPYNLFGLFSL